MKHNSEDLGFTQCLKRNPMACVHECKAQPGVITALSIYLMLNTVRKKDVLKIHVFIQISSYGLHNILVEYANWSRLCLSAVV